MARFIRFPASSSMHDSHTTPSSHAKDLIENGASHTMRGAWTFASLLRGLVVATLPI